MVLPNGFDPAKDWGLTKNKRVFTRTNVGIQLEICCVFVGQIDIQIPEKLRCNQETCCMGPMGCDNPDMFPPTNMGDHSSHYFEPGGLDGLFICHRSTLRVFCCWRCVVCVVKSSRSHMANIRFPKQGI